MFELALLAFLSAALIILLAPQLLNLGRWQIRRPKLALNLWLIGFFSGFLAALSGLIIPIFWAIGLNLEPTGATSGSEPIGSAVILVLAWLSLGIFGAVLAFIAVKGDPILKLGQSLAKKEFEEFGLFPRSSRIYQGIELVTIDTDEIQAYSLAGNPGRVVLSRGLVEVLSEAELTAVIEHEVSHLKFNHATLLQLVTINSLCTPKFSGAKKLLRNTTLLIELIADDRAAKLSGRQNLARALQKLAALQQDLGMTLRAERLLKAETPVQKSTALAQSPELL